MMFRQFGFCVAMGWSAMAVAAGPAAAPIHMGFTASWSMPWGQLQGETVVAGIHHDIGQAVAARLGRPLAFSRVPQQRELDPASAEHARRHADFGCGMHPSWFPNAEHYHWSEPLFDIGDVLVGHRGIPAPASLTALPRGTVVGTVRGYHYPTLQARFASGELQRDDAPDQASLLRKLMLKRSEVAVVSRQSLDWMLRQNPQAPLASWRLTVQAADYHCALPKGSQVEAQAVFDALHALKREGELNRILARYAPAAPRR
jgi:polar amino acid transport system substrate-binding protein